jgi:hypothetical protein
MSRRELGHKGGVPMQKFLERPSLIDPFGDEILDFYYEPQGFTVLFFVLQRCCLKRRRGFFSP